MSDIRVILCGVGGAGRNVTRLLSARPGYRVAAAYTRNAALAGQDLGSLAGISPLGVQVTTDREAALAQPADLLLIATTSFLREVAGDIRAGVERGLNVITTAEEAAFPWLTDERLANELDALAREHGVSVIGFGLNPGFIFDALLLTASGIAWDVQSIRLRRVVNISRFSATIQRRLGIGFTADEFEAGVKAGSITGHIGFPQSFHLAAKCFGRRIERLGKSFEPLIAEREYPGERLAVQPGTTAGFVQRSAAIVEAAPWMTAEFVAHIEPESAGYATADSFSIDGYNPINLTISPGCQPQLGTAGMIANCLPRVVEARPGFITVADLALPHARATVGRFS
jgi:4-hydroxy-tetrahydrodipicolinate reductase